MGRQLFLQSQISCLIVLQALVNHVCGDQDHRYRYMYENKENRGRYRFVQLAPSTGNSSRIKNLKAIRHSRAAPLILGVHIVSHDVTLAATLGGQVMGVIEVERFWEIRYFDFFWAMQRHPETRICQERTCEDTPDLRVSASKAVELFIMPPLKQLCRMVTSATLPQLDTGDSCDITYDGAVITDRRTDSIYVQALQANVKTAYWTFVDHHLAHATLGWLDSPFYHESSRAHETTAIVSYDGFGNDGTLRLFLGHSQNATLTPLGRSKRGHSYGVHYDIAASVVRDLAWGSPYGSQPPCPYYVNPACTLALPGSFMAYSALGVSRKEWHGGAQLFLRRGLWKDVLWPSPHGGDCSLVLTNKPGPIWMLGGGAHYFSCSGADDEDAARRLDRDFAATIQAIFEQVVVVDIQSRLAVLRSPPKSLVITGGCALNVKVNSALARTLGLPTHVPPAPGDNGLALGAAWILTPPPPSHHPQPIQYVGSALTSFSKNIVWSTMMSVLADFRAVITPNVHEVAELLMNGNIIGLVRGRAEFGPRALGHRSLLSAAHKPELKERLNRLKHRRWYRPCSPMVAAEDLQVLFEPGPDIALGSPYMSFAPPLQPWVKKWLPGITHLDGTARPQGVRDVEDPWLHSLLTQVRAIMGRLPSIERPHTAKLNATTSSKIWCNGMSMDARAQCESFAVGVLINTSLNPKGKPMPNELSSALSLFCHPGGEELDYLLVEEMYLIKRVHALESGICEELGIHYDKGVKATFADNLPEI